MRGFAHRLQLRVADLHGDPAALGAAVTVELCGHWEHEGPCRWPHHTSTDLEPDGTALVTVRYDADPSEVPVVRDRILLGLRAGTLAGPDDRITTWGAVAGS